MSRSYAEFRAGWTVIFAAACGSCAGITGILTNSRGILLGPLADAFGWSRTEIPAAMGFLSIGTMVTAPLVGYLADRIGVRRIGIVSLVLLAVATLGLTQMSGDIKMLSIGMFMLAVLGCGTTPLIWSRGVASWFVERRGLALGLTTAGTGVSWLITPALLGFVISAYDWRAAYVVMAALAAAALIPVVLFFRENSGRAEGSPVGSAIVHAGTSVKAALRSRQFWQIGLGILLVAAAVAAINFHLIALLTDAGIARSTALQLFSLLGVAIVVGRLIPGYLVDRFHPPYIAAVFLLAPVLSCFLLAGKDISMTASVIASLSVGLAAGAEVDLLPYLVARYFGLKSYGKIYGLQFVMLYLGAAAGPVLLGHTFETSGSYDLGLRLAVPFLVLGALAVATLGNSPDFESKRESVDA